MTPEEYLRRDRAAETKNEYDDGVVYAMPGANRWHSLIVAGLIGALGNRLGRRCEVYPNAMRVQITKPTRYYYPDVSVVCGKGEFADDDNLLNPVIVFEVLAENTMARDHGQKFHAYQTIDSLREYVLVWQDEYLVEHFRRGRDQWVYTVTRGIDATLPLPAAGCELPLREIYYQVELP